MHTRFVPPRYRLLYLHPTFVPRANLPISIYLPFYRPVYTVSRSLLHFFP